MSLGTIADAAQAITRLNDIFEAELLEDTRIIDHNLDVALRIEDVSFTWEAPAPRNETDSSQQNKGDKSKASIKMTDGGSQQPEKIFSMPDINLEIPRGQLVAIVGTVGSGKTSFLQGLIGEMRRTSGKVTFGGSVAYCSQNAFIQVCLWIRPFVGQAHISSTRTLQFARTYVLGDHLNQKNIGKLSRMLVWSVTLPYCRTET